MQDAREDAARMKLAMGSMRRELEVVKADCDTMHALYTRLALAAWGHLLAASSNVVLPPLLEAYMCKAAELHLQRDPLNRPQQQQQHEQVQSATCLDACRVALDE